MTDSPKTPAEWRAALVTALRSGKYKQGQGVLRNSDKFCCLGVACDISGLGKWRSTESVSSYDVGAAGNDRVLPAPVRDLFGLTTSGGDLMENYSIEGGGRTCTLDGLNDGGWRFEEIANLIEAGRVVVSDV